MNFFNWLINEFLGNAMNNVRSFVDFLARPFADPWKTIKKITSPKSSSRFRSFFLFLLLVLVIVGLGALTYFTGLSSHMTKGPPWFRQFWMGWVALLLYVIFRLGLAILRQMRVLSPSYSSFSDIDRAIQDGLDATENAGVSIEQVPLILVVGLSEQAEREFAKSQSIGKDVCSNDERAPVHFYGDDNALWVTLPGVSAVSEQADLLVAAQKQAKSAVPAAADAGSVEENAENWRTISIGAFLSRQDAEDDEAESQQLQELPGREVPPLTAKQRKVSRDRMRYFCQALQRARYPVCTVNAAVLCVPFCEEVVPEKVVNQICNCVRTDMSVMQEGLGVQCISSIVFTSCKDNPAFRSYIQQLPTQARFNRCGLSFPQLTQMAERDPEGVHSWLQRDFELQAMQLFRTHPGHAVNEDVFRFVDLVRRSRNYFTSVLDNAFDISPESAFHCGGIYFAELGTVDGVPHPLLGGILAKILHEHDDVISWTSERLRQDVRQRRVSRLMMTAAVALMATNIYLVWDHFMTPEG